MDDGSWGSRFLSPLLHKKLRHGFMYEMKAHIIPLRHILLLNVPPDFKNCGVDDPLLNVWIMIPVAIIYKFYIV